MKTLYETILDISDEQFDKAEQHPRIILDRVRKVLWDCFKGCLDLGYPIEDVPGNWMGFEYGEIEIGNIKSPVILKNKVASFISKLNQTGFKMSKKPIQDKAGGDVWYTVYPIQDSPLSVQFSVIREGSHYCYFISAPKILLQ